MSQKGFAAVIFLLICLVLAGVIGGTTYYFIHQKTVTPSSVIVYQSVADKSVTLPINELPKQSSSSATKEVPLTGDQVVYKNISFTLPGKITSKTEGVSRSTITYDQNKTLGILYLTPDSLMKVADLNLDKQAFANRYKNVSQPEIALQKMAIEKYSGNYNYDMAAALDFSDNLAWVKKFYLNIPNLTESVMDQDGYTIIYTKAPTQIMISLQDKQGNFYQLETKEPEEIAKKIIESIKIN